MEDIITDILAIVIAFIVALIYLLAIIFVGWGVKWMFDGLAIDIDDTLYWTGIALLIPFVIFGKVKGGKDD